MAGKLYSLAVPIGNTGDLSLRARSILETVDIVAAEDTRKFRELARRAGIETKASVYAYHSHNEKSSAQGLLDRLIGGESIVLLSDAGTPRLSDPGFALMKQAWESGIVPTPIPGPSALSALLSVSPFPGEPLLFLGFLSPKSGRRSTQLKKYSDFEGTVALYESVHRIEKLLEALRDWGNCPVLIGREMTKDYEEFFLGTLEEALQWIPGKKGEFSLLIDKRECAAQDAQVKINN